MLVIKRLQGMVAAQERVDIQPWGHWKGSERLCKEGSKPKRLALPKDVSG